MLFSELPQKSNKLQTGPTWRSRARTASLSLQQTGLAATWLVTSKTQPPTDCQQVLWRRWDPRPGYLKAPDVRTAGLYSAWSTSNCTGADTITQNYIPAGWIILAIKTWMCAHRRYEHTDTHTHTCIENVHKHLICHLGQVLRQAHDQPKPRMQSKIRDLFLLHFQYLGASEKETDVDRRRKQPLQMHSVRKMLLCCSVAVASG